MNQTPGRVVRRQFWADLLMISLCSLTSFWVLASPLIPYAFDLSTAPGFLLFLVTDLALSAVLSSIGISLNHLAARNARISGRRRRP